VKLAPALCEKGLNVVFLSEKLLLAKKLLTVVLSEKLDWLQIASSPVTEFAGGYQVVLSVRAASGDGQKVIEHERVLRERGNKRMRSGHGSV